MTRLRTRRARTVPSGGSEPSPATLRSLSRPQIGACLKDRGLRQVDIARRAGASTGWVNQTIAGRTPETPTTKRIWREIEAALALPPRAATA